MFVRRTYFGHFDELWFRFLIELLVRRIWFGQSRLYFVLNWLVMRGKLRPELAADAQQTARGWNGYRNKSQHRKSTLERKILPPLLGTDWFEPATLRIRRSGRNHWAIPAPKRERERAAGSNSNWTRKLYWFYKDCSLGLVKNLSSPC